MTNMPAIASPEQSSPAAELDRARVLIETDAPHIVLFTTTLDASGAERVVALLADGLSTLGYRVSVIALQRRSGALAKLIKQPNVRVQDFGASSYFDLGVASRLRRWLDAERVSVLYTFLFHAHVLGRYAGRHAGTPCVLSSQQTVAWGGRTRRMLERWTMRWCDCIVAVSKSVRDDLVEELAVPPDRVRVIANAIDVASFAPKTRPFDRSGSTEPITFGSASRLVVERDHESLVRGFALARRSMPQIRLRLAGTGPLLSRLESVARSEGVSNAVAFLGQVDDVREFHDGLDVYLQPSKAEGLPCAVVEAMAMRRPVVATDVPGNRDAVAAGTTGWLIPPGSPETWAAALIEAASDSPRAVAFGIAGRERAEALFDARLMIDSTVQLIEELRSRAPRR
jgi:glycosyltransferase involved in cell wall biosynthesis